MKPKRIKALKAHITPDNVVWSRNWTNCTEPCYVLRKSDVRALAEQIDRDYWEDTKIGYPQSTAESMLRAFKRAGMTPGKGTQ